MTNRLPLRRQVLASDRNNEWEEEALGHRDLAILAPGISVLSEESLDRRIWMHLGP